MRLPDNAIIRSASICQTFKVVTLQFVGYAIVLFCSVFDISVVVDGNCALTSTSVLTSRCCTRFVDPGLDSPCGCEDESSPHGKLAYLHAHASKSTVWKPHGFVWHQRHHQH